ncbi:MAG: tyrosine-protein phosphatase [Acutalibacteraceae bacterium]
MQLKHIPMDGPQNFRDLGGFLNDKGKAVVWNRLYRADGLSRLSERDILTFRKLNIKTVVDLRGTAEQKMMPDKLPADIAYFSCPMMKDDISSHDKTAENAFTQSLKIGYLEMIRENSAKVGEAVKTVMESVQKGAVVFHCTAGKDRTGVLAAVLLLRLGVCEQDITADYQVSYTYNQNGINRLVEKIPQLKEYLEKAGEDSMMHSNPRNIKAVLEILNTDNIEQWLKDAGVSTQLQRSFYDIMLENAE